MYLSFYVIFYSTVSLIQCVVSFFVALTVAVTSSLQLLGCMLLCSELNAAGNKHCFLHLGEALICMHVGQHILKVPVTVCKTDKIKPLV